MTKIGNCVAMFAILAIVPVRVIGQEKPPAQGEPQTAEEAYRRAAQLVQAKRQAEGIAMFGKAIFMKQDWAEAYAGRGWAQHQNKHYAEAIMDLDQAIKLEDGRAQWYNWRGLAYSHSGNHERGVEDYSRAMELNPNISTYYNNRGWAYRELGQYDNAIRDLTRAIQLTPDYVLAFENRVTAYVLMKDWPHAIADCTAAVELAPTSAHYLRRAEVRSLVGDSAGSEEDRRLAAAQQPTGQQATTTGSPASGTSAAPPPGVYKIGGGVTAPRLLSKVEPQYSDQAAKAKIEGTVVLYVVVTSEGTPSDLRVIRSLGMGLDEKAIEAVSKWKFSPGMKDGKPVAVQAAIEVNFRLFKSPTH